MDSLVFKALADENRLAIVEMLASGERCVCELSKGLDASDALISHHVKKLREAGLVKTRRLGQRLHCALDTDAFEELSSALDELGNIARTSESKGTYK